MPSITPAHNNVKRTTTDPITGSDYSNEYEAFGQSVSKIEPDDTPVVGGPGSIDEIQWMCGLYDQSRFWDSPVQCQIATIEGADPYFRDYAFGPIEKQSDPAKVALNDSPMDYSSQSDWASDQTMSYALTSSSKPKKKKKKNKEKPSDDDTIYGPADMTQGGSSVTIRDNNVPGFVDLSQDESDSGGYHTITRPGVKFIAGSVQWFLEHNPDCESLYNKVLQQLEKDTNVKLDGDIYHYVQEFGQTGTLSALAFTPANGGMSNTHGNSDPEKNYAEPGWGFQLAVSTNWGSKTFESFADGFLGELVHAIGNRNGKSLFSDDAGAAALAHLGIGLTLDEFSKLPSERPYLKVNGNGETFLPYGGSRLFHGILTETCAKLPGSPRFSGLR